jgi:hypothetical protein
MIALDLSQYESKSTNVDFEVIFKKAIKARVFLRSKK